MILVPGIKVRDNESFDEAYRRFKKQCDRNLIVTETRARRYFEPMTEIRKKQKTDSNLVEYPSLNAKKSMFNRFHPSKHTFPSFDF